MENQLLKLLQLTRDEGNEPARTELNELLRNNSEARKIMARLLIDEQALIGHLRDESIVSLLNSSIGSRKKTKLSSINRRSLLPAGAGLAAGLVIGLICVSVALGYARPTTLISFLNVADGDFNSLPTGPIKRGFSPQFGEWSGDPIEVTETGGNQRLRFMATGNVKGNPGGGASACNAFQFIDLTALQRQGRTSDLAAQQTLELSVRYDREPNSAMDTEFPKLKAGCAIYLFESDLRTVIEGWPSVLSDAVAVGKKITRMKPGEKSREITATCILEPEATIALITLDVGIGRSSNTPVKLGNYYADDVQLSLVTHPKLPVRIEK